jgi:hypothetical protein
MGKLLVFYGLENGQEPPLSRTMARVIGRSGDRVIFFNSDFTLVV